MAFTNFDTKEINCKIVYFGPRGSGKTANLRSLYSLTADEVKTGLIELSPQNKSPQFFDFLPISLGFVQDFHLKLHLFALPLHPLYETVSSVVLKGLDGFVYVADSRIERMGENMDGLLAVRRCLNDEGYNVADLPRVIQYNKRDLPGVAPLDILRAELNPTGAPDQEAVATEARGTMETLQAMAKQVIHRLAPAR